MTTLARKGLILILAALMTSGPGLVARAFAQDDADNATADEVQAVRNLAQKGYLGDKKDFYLSAKSMTEDDVIDALIKANDQLMALDLKAFKPEASPYQAGDLKALLALVKDKTEGIRARKVSEWKLERRIEKLISLLSPAPEAPEPAAEKPAPTATSVPPAPTATPVPGASKADLEQLRGDLKDLDRKMGDLQETYDKKMGQVAKSQDEVKKSNDGMRSDNAAMQEQLRLVKSLMDRVQSDLNKTEDRLDEVAKKAQQKTLTDTELQQDLSIMRKDMRDNTQDISVIKEQVARLDKSGEEKGQSAFDDLLGQKWVAGGALVVGLAALAVAIFKK